MLATISRTLFFLFLSTITLFSCTKKEESFLFENIKIDDLVEINLFDNKKKHSFKKKGDLFYHLRHGYVLDNDKVGEWIVNLNKIEKVKEQKGVALAGLSHSSLQLRLKYKTLMITGYDLPDISKGYVSIQSNIKRENSGMTNAYISTESLKTIFLNPDNFRRRKYDLTTVKKVSYVFRGKTVKLNEEDKIRFLKIMGQHHHTSFVYNGRVDEHILRKTGIGLRINNNPRGYFLLESSKGSLKLITGRPVPKKPIIRLWLEGTSQVVESEFLAWYSLEMLIVKLEKPLL